MDGPDDSAAWDVRLRWEEELSAGRWLGLTWPPEFGGRGATLAQAIIFEYFYARAQRPVVSVCRGRTYSARRC